MPPVSIFQHGQSITGLQGLVKGSQGFPGGVSYRRAGGKAGRVGGPAEPHPWGSSRAEGQALSMLAVGFSSHSHVPPTSQTLGFSKPHLS